MVKAVGIVGGMGPYAGIDLLKKVHNSVVGYRDQDYPDVYMVSAPRLIPDRSSYLAQPTTENPAIGIITCVEKLSLIGATHIGISCNTAHSRPIMGQVRAIVAAKQLPVTILNIVQEVLTHAKEYFGKAKLGLLATVGTYKNQVYQEHLPADETLGIVLPTADEQALISQAIYSQEFGIKKFSAPVKDQAISCLSAVAQSLIDRGCDAIILGCTELPLAMDQADYGVPLLDSSLLLARALVKAVAPEKLKPLSSLADK